MASFAPPIHYSRPDPLFPLPSSPYRGASTGRGVSQRVDGKVFTRIHGRLFAASGGEFSLDATGPLHVFDGLPVVRSFPPETP